MVEPSSQQPPPPAPPPESPPKPTAAQVAAVAVVLAAVTASGDGSLAGAALRRILKLLIGWGYDRRAARASASIVLTVRQATYGTTVADLGPAELANARREPVYDAWFLLNAGRRMHQRLQQGQDPAEVLDRERRHLEQRQRAREARRRAAEKVDQAAQQPGTLEVNGRRVLGWRAHPDDKTTWECVAADGHWFYADRPPFIGYPGMPHGGTCRCWVVPATPAMLRGDTVDDAVRSAQGTATADHPAERYPKPVPLPDDPEEAAS